MKEKSQNYNDRILNSNVWKNKIRIPMPIEIGIDTNIICKGKIRIPMSIKIEPEFQRFQDKIIIPMLVETGPVSQCFEG